MNARRRILIGALAAAVAGGGYFAFGALSKRALASPSVAPTVRTVRVQEVHGSTDVSAQTFTGVVHARYESDLSFRVGGKVVTRLVEVGTRVRAGQAIARLDPGDNALAVKEGEADLAAADAALRQAQIEYDRTAKLVATNAIAGAELDRVTAERDSARARRERARASANLSANRLAYCTLKADSDGVVTSLPIEAGQVVAEGQLVARVARDGQLEAVVSIPENRVAAVRAGVATVTFWSLQGAPRRAVLRELSPSADPVTRTYTARFTIENPGTEIALGMTATVSVMPATPSDGHPVPLSALLRKGTSPAVWVVDRATGHLTLTPIEVVQYRQDTAIVTGGVKDGALIVTAGVQKLDAEMTVRPWEPAR